MTDEAMSPLRRRMIEDMTIRKFAPKTQHDYVQRVKNCAAFLGRSPDTASFEDVRRYQLHLAESGVGVPTLNQTVATLRFFFRITLKRHDIIGHTTFISEPRKLPVVLSPEEVARWVTSCSNFLVHVNVLARLFRGKMLAMLMAAHDAGQLKFFNTHAGLADKRTFKRFIGPLRTPRASSACSFA